MEDKEKTRESLEHLITVASPVKFDTTKLVSIIISMIEQSYYEGYEHGHDMGKLY